MARIGISIPVIEKVLGHTSGTFAGIVATYQHHDFANEKREALELWAKHIGEIVLAPAGTPVDGKAQGKALAPAEAVA
jgi:hypothetical protein